VLRLDRGRPVSYTDGSGTTGEGIWEGTEIRRGAETSIHPPVDVAIAVAPPKGSDRQRFVVEKLAELGVARLIWLSTRYGDARPPKTQKADAWAIGALEQSRGAWKMRVEGPIRLEALPADFVLADADGAPLRREAGPVTIAIGPAGGWHPEELVSPERTISFGAGVLRTETAAVTAAVLATRC
jgi:16S rRNA (uracil1498-N3)-methyltransferase